MISFYGISNVVGHRWKVTDASITY